MKSKTIEAKIYFCGRLDINRENLLSVSHFSIRRVFDVTVFDIVPKSRSTALKAEEVVNPCAIF